MSKWGKSVASSQASEVRLKIHKILKVVLEARDFKLFFFSFEFTHSIMCVQ